MPLKVDQTTFEGAEIFLVQGIECRTAVILQGPGGGDQDGGAGLEATLIAVDNSGYMINTDHRPSRLQSQYECVNLVCTVKTQIQKPINLTPKPITLPPKHINIEPEPTNPRRCAPSRPRTRKTLWVC